MVRSKGSMFLDKAVVFLLYCMAILPFAQVFHMNIGFAIINAVELLLLSLCFVFIIIIINRGIATQHLLYVFLVIAIFVFYSSYSLVFLDVSFSSWVNQTRHFLPFLVACMALLTRLYIDIVKFLNGITFVIAISAVWAIIMHLFFQDFIAYAFAANNEVVRIIIEGGRMYWGSSALAMFGLTALMIERDSSKRKLLGFAVIVVLVGSVFTQSRTMLGGLLVFYVFAQLFVFKKRVRPVIYISVIALIVAASFLLLASDNMIELLQSRLFLTDSAGAEIERAFTVGKVGNYIQYLDILRSTLPLGQGLGLPFSYGMVSGEPIYISDISLVSFSIPFGVLGLGMLLMFIYRLLKSFQRYATIYCNATIPRVFYWLLVSAFLISLNVDVFSRNIFVVFLAVFAVIHFVPSDQTTQQVRK